MDRLKKLFSPDALVDPNQIIVSEVDGEKLDDAKKLVDFVIEHKKLVVRYPDGQITFRQRKTSLVLEAEFFALLDS